jgi:endoglycosylceramidase
MPRVVVAALALLAALCAAPAPAAALPLTVQRGADPAITTTDGREVLLRGINVNQLGDYWAADPAKPTVIPLREDDMAGIARLGFNTVRLVLNWSALQPAPGGGLDPAELARIRQAVGWARAHGLLVVLDMHQDSWGKDAATPPGTPCPPGFGPAVGWDGAPSWATRFDGQSTCRAADTRELSPAVAQAFTNFFLDRDGIQGELVATWGRLAGAFAGDETVVGYDLLNEPHPGNLVGPNQSVLLGRFYARTIEAIRAAERAAPGGRPKPVFFEPSVLWSGFGTDALPPPGFSPDPFLVFAPHLYSESISVDRKAGLTAVTIEQGFELARRAAERYGVPLWSGEWAWFGSPEDDLGEVRRYVAQEDASAIGGAWWVWKQACGDPHVAGQPTFAGSLNPVACPGDRPLGQVEPYARLLSRAYSRAAPGRITGLRSDATSGRFIVAGRDEDPAGSCALEVWVPGTAEPALTAEGITDLRVRRVPGGFVAGGCARGAYVLRGAPGEAAAAPPGAGPGAAPGRACRSRRALTIRLRVPARTRLRSVVVRVPGQRPVRLRGNRRTVRVDLRGRPPERVVVRIDARTTSGRALSERRAYRTCVPRPPAGR